MELKWILVIVLEVGFWALLAGFLVLRYWFGYEQVTRWFVVGVVIDTLGFVALGIWDFAKNGEVSTYTVVIGGLLVYAFVWGKKDMQRFDAWMERKAAAARRRPARESA